MFNPRNFRGNRGMNSYATIVLTVVALASYVLAWLTHGALIPHLAFIPSNPSIQGWIVWPFAKTGDPNAFIFELLDAYILYFTGKAIESAYSWRGLIAIYFGSALFASILFFMLNRVSPGVPPLYDSALCTSCVLTVYAAANKSATFLLYFFPVRAPIVVLIAAGFLLFSYGSANLLAGVLILMPLLLCWFIGDGQLSASSLRSPRTRDRQQEKQERESKKYLEDVRRREMERQEKEELRKLFERSMIDDPDDPDQKKKS